MEQLNVLGNPLALCCTSPMTGAYRDGYCNTGANDFGTHTVCAIITDEFLQFSKTKGNDLMSPNPLYNSRGCTQEINGACVCLAGLRPTGPDALLWFS